MGLWDRWCEQAEVPDPRPLPARSSVSCAAWRESRGIQADPRKLDAVRICCFWLAMSENLVNTPDPEAFFRPPNDNAYTNVEIRTGPPLDYIADKVPHYLGALHSLINEIEDTADVSDAASFQRTEVPNGQFKGDLKNGQSRYVCGISCEAPPPV